MLNTCYVIHLVLLNFVLLLEGEDISIFSEGVIWSTSWHGNKLVSMYTRRSICIPSTAHGTKYCNCNMGKLVPVETSLKSICHLIEVSITASVTALDDKSIAHVDKLYELSLSQHYVIPRHLDIDTYTVHQTTSVPNIGFTSSNNILCHNSMDFERSKIHLKIFMTTNSCKWKTLKCALLLWMFYTRLH